MMRLLKKIFNKRTLIWFVFLSLVFSTAFITVRIILAPTVAPEGSEGLRVKSDYVLMLLQCAVGVIAMILPVFLSKRHNIDIPANMFFVYAVFLYCAIYLGEVRSFYYLVPHWDTILHVFSGAMLAALGFSFILLLNRTDRIPISLSPVFVAVFTFCFAVSIGVIWEIYEFTADAILGTNMQKFMFENGEPLVGRAALTDTMKDLIVDCIGAAFTAIIGYISLKYKKGWLETLQLKRRKRKMEKEAPSADEAS